MLVNRIFATGRALPQIATVGKCLPFIFGIIIGASVAHAEETFQSRIQKCCKSDQIFFNGTCTVYEGDGDLNHWPFDTTVVSDYPELSVQFDIQYGSGFPKCPFGWINHTLSWNSDAVEFYILRNDYDASVIKIENNKEIKHEDFCVDRRFSGNDQEDFDGFEIKYCLLPPESLCKGAPCVRICCPQGYDKVFSPDEDACVPFPEDGSLDRWQPTLHDRQGDPIQEKAEDLEFFYGYPPETDLCARLHVHDSREDPFKIMESGDLVIGNQEYSYNEYCISPILLGLDDESRYEKIYVCHKRVDSEEEKYLNGLILTILPILLGMSCFFLFLTFILIFNRNRDKIFGVMTLCMVAMLFIFYLGLLVPYVTGSEHVEDAPGLCQFEGLAIQYTYISAMCWLNCMSYLIWKSFRKIRRTSEHDAKGWKNRQFLR